MEQVRKGGLPPLLPYSGGKPLFLTCSIHLMLEMPDAGENHCQTMLICGGDHFLIAH
jgi:hypothetical protein